MHPLAVGQSRRREPNRQPQAPADNEHCCLPSVAWPDSSPCSVQGIWLGDARTTLPSRPQARAVCSLAPSNGLVCTRSVDHPVRVNLRSVLGLYWSVMW